MLLYTRQARFAIQMDNARFMLIVDTHLHVTWTRTRNDLKNHYINKDGDDDPDMPRSRPPNSIRSVHDYNNLCDWLAEDQAKVM